MSLDLQTCRRLKRINQNRLDKSLFETSMGDQHPILIQFNAAMDFIAMAIAYYGYFDQKFLGICISLMQNCQRIGTDPKQPKNHPVYQFCVHIGGVVERSIALIKELHDEDVKGKQQ